MADRLNDGVEGGRGGGGLGEMATRLARGAGAGFAWPTGTAGTAIWRDSPRQRPTSLYPVPARAAAHIPHTRIARRRGGPWAWPLMALA